MNSEGPGDLPSRGEAWIGSGGASEDQVRSPHARQTLAKSLGEVVTLLFSQRRLIGVLSRREITDRYSGQVLGILWVLGHPLILMGVYIFVFAVVFKLKLGNTVNLPFEYPVYILSGLIPWLTFQDATVKSCTAVTARANLVKHVVFPVEVLAVHPVVVSCVTQLVGSTILILYVLVSHGAVPWTYIFLPLLVLSQFVLMVGLSFVLSSISVFVRDTREIVLVCNLVGLYLMPIFYLPEWIPDLLKPLVYLNPFSHMVWCYQDVLYFGRFDHVYSWPIFAGMSISAFCAGALMFRRLKTYFSGAL